MAKVVIVYGTTEGQTAKIAQHMARSIQAWGHGVDVVHGAEIGEDFDFEAYDGAIVGASVHESHHQRYIRRFIREHRDWLSRHPSAFAAI